MRQLSIATLLTLALSMFFATTTRADERLPITQLVMRDRVIVIDSDSNGLVYSVSTKDGTMLDAKLSEEQLQAKYPDVYETVRPAIANREASKNDIQWIGDILPLSQ